jgi:hypothetical protein
LVATVIRSEMSLEIKTVSLTHQSRDLGQPQRIAAIPTPTSLMVARTETNDDLVRDVR